MTSAAPRFCIVTPSYNTRDYLGPCIDSVLAQQGVPVDYLVMDGGSTDGTVDLLRSYGDRFRWVSERDGGQSDALSRGFGRVGSGDPNDVLGWLNSDDTYAPGAFAHVAEVFAKRPDVDIVYGDATYIDARGKHISPCTHIEPYSERRLFYYSDFIVQPTTFFRRRALDAVGGINVALHWIMDYELWLRFAGAGFRFAYTPRVLAHFRWLSNNKTATGGMSRLDEIDRTFGKLGLPPPAYVQLERCLQCAKQALMAFAGGRIVQGIGSIGRGARTLVHSPRAVLSLFDPFTWQVILTGQILRARSEAADRRMRQRERR